MAKYKNLFYSCIVSTFLASCAQIVPPTGGEIDSTPPEILSTNLQDSTINFSLREIEFKFDEVVQASGKVVTLSPLIEEDFEVKAVHKTLRIKVPLEALAKNTTYTLSLDGVQDVTENNALPLKTYIFSTGAYLDSLSIKGRVFMSETNQADTSVKVYLFRAEDSLGAIRKKKPAYLASVAFSGVFEIEAIPAGNYRLFALADENQNYVYDSEAERFAFDTTVYRVSADTTNSNINLFTWSDDYKESAARDTKRRPKKTDGFSYVLSIDTANKEAQQDVYYPLDFEFSTPLQNYDSTLFSCTDTTEESVVPLDFSLDSGRTKLSISPEGGWIASHGYKIFLKEGALQDSTNRESSTHYFFINTLSQEDYSTVLIHFTPVDSSLQYVCQMKLGTRISDFILNTDNGFDIYSAHALGPDIQLTYFEDVNRNGQRDFGSLDDLRQPEIQLKVKEKLIIKKNWDHIFTIKAEKPGALPKKKRSLDKRKALLDEE